jgi:hypothetical protein
MATFGALGGIVDGHRSLTRAVMSSAYVSWPRLSGCSSLGRGFMLGDGYCL